MSGQGGLTGKANMTKIYGDNPHLYNMKAYRTPAENDRAALKRIIRVMKSTGAVHTWAHDGDSEFDSTGMGEKELIANLMACDSSMLKWDLDDSHVRMFFVLGNEPFEICADMAYVSEKDAVFQAAEWATGERVLPDTPEEN